MTCVIGYLDEIDKRVYIGADTLGTDVSSGLGEKATMIDSKIIIFHIKSYNTRYKLLLGYEGSYSVGQAITYRFRPNQDNEDYKDDANPKDYICKTFVPQLKAFLEKENFSEEEASALYIVGYQGHLYEIQSDFYVNEPLMGFSVIGNGYGIAQGALYYHRYLEEKQLLSTVFAPIDIIKSALICASTGSASVSPPFQIFSVKNNEINIDLDEMPTVDTFKLYA